MREIVQKRFSKGFPRVPSLEEILRLSGSLEIGLKSGRDWLSILKWISENDSAENLRSYLKILINKIRVDKTERSLKEEAARTSDKIWKLFIEILLQAHRGTQKLSQLFQSFSVMVNAIQKLKQKERSLLFVPRFQMWTAVAITLGFMFGLPLLAPSTFPTFLSLKRYDLFCAGLIPLVFGFALLHWMCARPKRLLSPLLSTSFFFYFLSVFVESGIDLATAWLQAAEIADFPMKTKSKLVRHGLHVESMQRFLTDLQKEMPDPWPGILAGLIWTQVSGLGLSDYLKSVSRNESERVLFLWEDEIRKLTLTTLVPLGIFIFLPTLFLLVGPQLVDLAANL